MALEQGREVFAVAGSPLDPRCKGTNGLIRNGATLTESAQDVVDALSGMLRGFLAEPFSSPSGGEPNHWNVEEKELSQARPRVREALGMTPVTVDDLIRECQLSAAVVLTVLLELELAGRVERHPGSRFSLSS
jgi:DNA processing protein